MRTTHYREKVLGLIREERARQIDKYGLNDDLPLGFGSSVSAYPWLMPYSDAESNRVEAAFRADYKIYEEQHGKPTWMHLIREEVAELFDTRLVRDTLTEAVQVAALCVSLCERLLAEHDGEPYEAAASYTLSDANRMLLYRAYDDGAGNTITIQQGDADGYFVGLHEGVKVMEGVEIDGTLYSICLQSDQGQVTVLVGEEIVQNVVGPTFSSFPEARTYIKGLMTK